MLNISQPAVAQALEKLEQICGLRLFLRHHARGAELTPEGRAFLESATRLVQCAEQTETDAQAIASNHAGVLRFGCFHTLAPFYLSEIMGSYKTAKPDVRIIASELRQDEIFAGVNNGELDLALTYDMSSTPEHLEYEILVKLRPFIILSEQHPLADRSSIKMTALAKEPYVMFDGPSSRDYFENLLASLGVAPPVSLCAKSMESVRSAVASGLGVSLSGMNQVHPETYDGGRVKSVPIAGRVETLSIILVSKGTRSYSALVDNFATFCHTLFLDHSD